MKIKFFKKHKNFKKEGFWMDINFYWRIALYIMFIVLIIACIFGYYLFRKVKKEIILPEQDSSGKVQMVKKERIEKVLEYFSNRKEKSNEILYSSPSVVDPSL